MPNSGTLALEPVDLTAASLVSVVEASIEQAILGGRLTDGDPLTEAALAAALGVSRSPVRDALKRLARKGMVEARGRRGFAVATIDPDRVMDFLGVREALEGLAARLAAERMPDDDIALLRGHLDDVDRALRAGTFQGYPEADEDFHAMVLRGARSEQLSSAMEPVATRTRLLRRRSGARPDRARQALAEHRAIAGAVARRDPDEAEALMRAHVRMAKEHLLAMIRGDAL
jgi:DNA-binding GntR family transcriptional regulator